MTEKVEVSDRQAYWLLPQSKIPFLDTRNIGTYKGEYGKEYQYNARIDMSLEFAQKTLILICSHDMIFKNGRKFRNYFRQKEIKKRLFVNA